MGLTELSELLKLLPQISHDNLLVGINTADDAGVYKLNDDTALIQTVDIFTPLQILTFTTFYEVLYFHISSKKLPFV